MSEQKVSKHKKIRMETNQATDYPKWKTKSEEKDYLSKTEASGVRWQIQI